MEEKKRKFFGATEDDKPLVTEEVQEGPDGLPTTVDCPVHHLPLQIQTENREKDGKTVFVRFAVCNCKVQDNTHEGKRVWEQL